jgi:dihydroorotate dehydrogenase (fumarate)
VSEAKAQAGIPVIASIHCVSARAWPDFAGRLEQAGADGLELNLFVLPSDPNRDSRAVEQVYHDVAAAVRDKVRIPVALKLGSYFSGLANMARTLGSGKVAALTLFNRFFSVDIDIDRMELAGASFLSEPGEYVLPLRWISILHHRVDCDLCAATGAHDAPTVIKLLLAGADAVQVVSALYKHGVSHVATILDGIEAWMAARGFRSVDDFRGKLSQAHLENPAAWERVQFMKFAAGVE